MLKPIDRAVLSNQVFEQLRDEILTGGYEPGHRLPSERELCEILQVNRSSVREALKRLEQAKLIEVQQGGGSVVLDFNLHAGFDLMPFLVGPGGALDPNAFRSVCEFKLMIGPEIARYAAMRIKEEDLARLEEIVDQIDGCGKDVALFQELDFEFHYIMARASENLAFLLLYNSIRSIYEQARIFFVKMYQGTLPLKARYRSIYRAISDHNSELAGRLTREITEAAIKAFD